MRILVTGAAGYTGTNLIRGLKGHTVLATDVRFEKDTPLIFKNKKIHTVYSDVRDCESLRKLFKSFKPEAVVHLASIVTPGKKSSRAFEYAVDVTGTQNILSECVASNVKRLIVTSSGAAYGYHADNPVPLRETDPVRGNKEFAYSYHKRLVEEILREHTAARKKPDVVIFRIGTILGEKTKNQITALFEKKNLPGICNADSPFVFIWDEDVVGAITHALKVDKRGKFIAPAGVFNLAGDGWMTLDKIAARLRKKVRRWPALFLKVLFGVLKPLGLSRYGSEQVRFLQFRPVLDNTQLKTVFGFKPQKTSEEVFDYYSHAQKLNG